MNKTIKIIELLNKIANGEEVPEKIIYLDKKLYIWNTEVQFYETKDRSWTLNFDTNELNDEVEIIENEKDNKIKYVGKNYDLTNFYRDYEQPAIMLRDMADKMREIIDEVNKLKEVK